MGWEFLAFAVVMLVASYAITTLMAKKPQGSKPNVIADFQFPQFEEGTPQAVLFGDCWCPDWMVLSTSDFRTSSIKAKKTGKK